LLLAANSSLRTPVTSFLSHSLACTLLFDEIHLSSSKTTEEKKIIKALAAGRASVD
jgi:hypothetical protein